MKIPADKRAFWKEESPAETPQDQTAAALKNVADTLNAVAKAVIEHGYKELPVPKPAVNVNVPDKPKRWLFTVKRDYTGRIETINAEALD